MLPNYFGCHMRYQIIWLIYQIFLVMINKFRNDNQKNGKQNFFLLIILQKSLIIITKYSLPNLLTNYNKTVSLCVA